jgi:5-hydroxyisourate hydrolase
MTSPITTHILDTAKGQPAQDVPIVIFRREAKEEWKELGAGRTNADGRVVDLLPEGSLEPGVYRIYFDTETYFKAQSQTGFYPYVEVVFEIKSTDQHYHVPLLLNPFGYSTYRGS